MLVPIVKRYHCSGFRNQSKATIGSPMFDTGKDRHLCFRGEISPFFIDCHIRTRVPGSDIPYQELMRLRK